MKRTVLAILAASALLGCHKKTSADKCKDFTGAFGKKAIQCLMITQATWDTYINQQLDCSKVTTVSSNVDSCVKDVNNGTCGVLFQGDTPTPPASCANLFTAGSGSTPAQKCQEFTGAFGKRAIQCLMVTQATWDTYINQQLDCSKVTEVGSNLDSCVKDINNGACDAIFQGDTPTPPASCSMLLTIKQ